MGNTSSKKGGKSKRSSKKSQSLPPPPRLDLPDNEYSTNTTQSVSSILLTSQHRQQQQKANGNLTTLAQLNPDYPVKDEHDESQDTVQRQDPFQGKVEHPQQHKLLAQSDFWPPHRDEQQNMDDNNNTLNGYNNNQLTVASMNQLTVNSINSMNGSSISPAQLDDYIQRLLEVGYASKVPKQLCLKTAEVSAICRAAMDIFLSQPVSGNARKRSLCNPFVVYRSHSWNCHHQSK